MKKAIEFFLIVLVASLAGVGTGRADDPNEDPECPDVNETDGPTYAYATMFLNRDEASGPKYRKVGLNGFPVPDEKPQQKEETDEEPEETHIDAFNHTLSHQVTDIYVPMQGSDLALSVRRNWSTEIWDLNALAPSAGRPDLPFGVGWSSSLGASIKFVSRFGEDSWREPAYAYVTDTNGASYRFLVLPFYAEGVLKFFPMPENRSQQEVLGSRLEQDGDGFEFTSKYGTKIKFGPLGGPGNNLVAASADLGSNGTEGTYYSWARMESAEDRYGTTITYAFAGTNATIIPYSMSCRGKTITVTQQNGRVTRITDPRGKHTDFTYTDQGVFTSGTTSYLAPLLVSVTREDDSQTVYTYDTASEYDRMPRDISDPARYNRFFHVDLGSITDPNDHTYTFNYAYDRSRANFMYQTHYKGWYRPSGIPRNVTQVTLPNGAAAHFENNSNAWLTLSGTTGQRQTAGTRSLKVTDAGGGVWQYAFSEGFVTAMDELAELAFPDPDVLHKSLGLMIFYEKMTVSTPEGGEMVATFDRTAGMALKSFKDVGASAATTFTYDDSIDLASAFSWLPAAAIAQMPIQKWGDPTSQTNGMGGTKTFEYQGTWRIMSKITDEDGRVTEYTIDPDNGNRTEERIRLSAQGAVVQKTVFQYGNSPFQGILTRKTVQALGGSDPGWAVDLITENTLESVTGNVITVKTGTSQTHSTYDDNNNKLTSTDANGNFTTFVYDDLNRLTQVQLPGSASKSIFYDARGNKVREDDERGISTLMEYDALNRVVKQARDMDGGHTITGPDLVSQFAYNALNAKTSVTNPRGHTTSMEYDGLNRPVKTTDPLGKETTFEYGANSGGLQFGKDFLPVRSVDPRGFETLAVYDANNRPTEKSAQYVAGGSPLYAVSKWEYDGAGNVVKETDPLNRETTRTYDALKRVIETVNSDGTETHEYYTSTGLKWKMEDELGEDTLVEYDNQGRPVKTSSPEVDNGLGTNARAVTQTEYDDAGNVVETINPLGRSWTFEYDNRNRKVKEIRPGTGSPTLEWVYDAAGNVTKVIDARGAETETIYDAANRATEIKQPLVAVYGSGTSRPTTFSEFDKNGNVVKLTDPNGHETNNTYDELNRLVATEDAEGIIVENEYDEVGNKTAVIDGEEQRTEFEYDGLNRNTRITDAANKSTTFEFDAVNKTARVDGKGQRTEYGYDNRNRLTAVSYTGRSQDNREYEYDATGNLLAVTEPHASKAGKADVSYSYDALRRVLTEESTNATHTYKYDLAGNRINCLYGGFTNPLVSAYDEQNRLTALTDGARVTTYTYDANGNNLTKALPNGNVVTTTYDALNRKLTHVGNKANSNMIYSYIYGYDKAGNVRAINETFAVPAANRTIVLTYDDINRLTQEAITGNGASTTSYTYDDAHNRSTMAVSGTSTSYTYNSKNQLTSAVTGTSTISFTYDDNGNRLTRTKGATTDTFGWDYENRLVSLIKQSTGGTGTYSWMYDYRTRRVSFTKDATTTDITFSGGVSVGESENGTSSVGYVRGSDWGGGVGGILYTLRSGAIRYNHYNTRGDVVVQMDASQNTTYAAQYKAFGDRSETGSSPDRQRSNTKDEDMPGYANEGFRFRDIETGAFISRDPAGFIDGPNLYAYVVQNPWTSFDPDGLATKKEREETRDGLIAARSTLQRRLDRSTALGEKSRQTLVDQIKGLSAAVDAETKAINKIEATAKYMKSQADKLATLGVDKTDAYKRADNLDDTSDEFKGWAATAAMADFQTDLGSAVLLDGAGRLVLGAAGRTFGMVKNLLAAGTKTATGTRVVLGEGDVLLAVVKDGKVIAQGSPGLSHAELVTRKLGGKLPEGAEVVTIMKSQGKLFVQNSQSYMNNREVASGAAQAAANAAFK